MSAIDAVKLLETFGPWAIVVIIGLAYWRKDKQVIDLLEKQTKLIENKTVTDTKLEATLNGLKNVIMVLTGKSE